MAGEKERGGGNQGLSHMLRVSNTQMEGGEMREEQRREQRGADRQTDGDMLAWIQGYH